MALSSIALNPTNTSPIAVSVTLNESSADFAIGDITPVYATVANFAASTASGHNVCRVSQLDLIVYLDANTDVLVERITAPAIE